jgi:hypothetical protein
MATLKKIENVAMPSLADQKEAILLLTAQFMLQPNFSGQH